LTDELVEMDKWVPYRTHPWKKEVLEEARNKLKQDYQLASKQASKDRLSPLLLELLVLFLVLLFRCFAKIRLIFVVCLLTHN